MKKIILSSVFLILVLVVAQNVSGNWKTKHWDVAPICGNKNQISNGNVKSCHWETAPLCEYNELKRSV